MLRESWKSAACILSLCPDKKICTSAAPGKFCKSYNIEKMTKMKLKILSEEDRSDGWVRMFVMKGIGGRHMMMKV